jgi:Predicted phosphohydrolases
LIIPFYIFQGAILLIGIYLLAGKIIKIPFLFAGFILKKINPLKEKLSAFRNKKTVIRFDKSRRAFLTTSTALVSGYAFLGAGLGVLKKDDYEITGQVIFIENLPTELEGVTMTLISDIHAGSFMDAQKLKEYADVINDLRSDLILIPGDLTNSNKEEAQIFSEGFKSLNAPYGVFGTLGNHDYFRDAEYIANVVSNESPVKLLRNESEILKINGKEICLLGVEDTRESGAGLNPKLMEYLNTTVEASKEKLLSRNLSYDSIPKILLFHKPYYLKEISDKNFDIILSGHTHGGQIVFAQLGNLNLSIAATVSPYINGLYTHGKSNMYVSRGIGTVGLPIRLNCPPEITKITLRKK